MGGGKRIKYDQVRLVLYSKLKRKSEMEIAKEKKGSKQVWNMTPSFITIRLSVLVPVLLLLSASSDLLPFDVYNASISITSCCCLSLPCMSSTLSSDQNNLKRMENPFTASQCSHFFFLQSLRNLSSCSTIFLGKPAPTPNSTNGAHFQRKGFTKMTNTNQYSNSAYVKKSKAPVGAFALTHRVKSIQRFIHVSVGRVRGSTRNIKRKRV